ncbi:hypothetical protein WMF38_57510 [Sorangium sp. So ce118]
MEANANDAGSFVRMSGNGAPVPPKLDSLIRTADAYPQAITTVQGFGLGQGDTIKLRRPVFAGGGYSLADRRVAPDKATETTGQTISAEEVAIILEEYEGPYNASAAKVRPFAIRDFDAKYRANRDELVSLVKLHLMQDYVKWFDTVIRDLFRATSNTTYADNVSNVLSFTSGAGHNISLETILTAQAAITDRNWQHFPNGHYVLAVPTAFDLQMVGDPDYRALSAQHGDGKNQLHGYITSVHDVDLFRVSTLKTYSAGETVPGDGNAVPSGATVYEALLFGPGAVGWGSAQPPQCFDADDTNFGKESKVIWRSVEAFQTLDNRGIQRILFQA